MIEPTSSDKTGQDPISNQLAAAGVQPTAQRVEIARVLLDRPRHLSADRISAILLERGIRVSKATVYNTLKLLCATGLAKAIIVDPNRVFYDSTTEPHHHFYNVDSGELTDIPAEQVRFADLPALPQGTAQEGVDVIVRVRDNVSAG
ncbi:MAG TPA: Fur family transcriptional regulator [Gammaproteobacteria bacterium]|nr:Fur family transcriptional regulator [Gammaproteobacteria bacterium]